MIFQIQGVIAGNNSVFTVNPFAPIQMASTILGDFSLRDLSVGLILTPPLATKLSWSDGHLIKTAKIIELVDLQYFLLSKYLA